MLKKMSGIIFAFLFCSGVFLRGQTPRAVIISPAPGSTLSGTSVTFTWTADAGVANCVIYIGTQSGGSDVFSGNPVYTNSQTISTIPTNGATLYLRLFSSINGVYQYNDYTYIAPNASGPPSSPVTTSYSGNGELPLLVGSTLSASSMIESPSGVVTFRAAYPYSPFNIKGPTLSSSPPSRSELLSLQNFNGALNNLHIFQQRNYDDNGTWYSASTKIQNDTAGGAQGYIEFNPSGSPDGVAIGTGPNELMRLLENGYVGIGTHSPASMLEVNGDIRFTGGSNGGLLFPDGSALRSAAALSGLTQAGGQLSFSGNRFSIGGGTTGVYGDGLNTVLQASPNGFVYMAPIGIDGTRVGNDGSLRVGGTQQSSSMLYVPKSGSAAVSVGLGRFLAAVPDEIQVDGNPGSNGSTGLWLSSGTSSGAAKAFQIYVKPDDAASGAGLTVFDGAVRSSGFLFTPNTPGATIDFTMGALGNQSTALHLSDNGNVGIGNTTPQAKLDITGTLRLSGASGTGIIYPDGTIQSTAASGGPGPQGPPGPVGPTGPQGPAATSVSGYVYDASSSTGTIPGIIHAQGNSYPVTTPQGAYLGWNALTGGAGETDFINSQGHGGGGFAFMKDNGDGTRTTVDFIDGSGNLGVGTISPSEKLEVNGNIKLTASGLQSHITFPDGSQQTVAWTGVVPANDYADSVGVVGASEMYMPGEVLLIDADHPRLFHKASEPYSRLVAGVYSTKPGVLGKLPDSKGPEVPMALNGIVPTKVSAENGPVHPGDLLVSATLPGYAMKGTDSTRLTGAILGKALGSVETGTGTIDVLIALQ